MFGKLNTNHLAHSFHKAKGFLQHAYHQTKGFLSHVDHGVRVAKHIYGAVAPLLDKYASSHANQIHSGVRKAVSNYDTIRHKVIEGDNDIKHLKKTLHGY